MGMRMRMLLLMLMLMCKCGNRKGEGVKRGRRKGGKVIWRPDNGGVVTRHISPMRFPSLLSLFLFF